jgi:hypothetical protein
MTLPYPDTLAYPELAVRASDSLPLYRAARRLALKSLARERNALPVTRGGRSLATFHRQHLANLRAARFGGGTLTDVASEIATAADTFEADEAEYRANRATAHAHFDAHRDAALAKLGYI